MEKVIIDIGLLNQWCVSYPENSQENTRKILKLLNEHNFQPYIFDFQAKLYELKVLKSQLKGIRIKIIEKKALENSWALLANYEEQFNVKLSDLEKMSFLSYAGCGFSGIQYFLRNLENSSTVVKNFQVENKFLTFNIELVKI